MAQRLGSTISNSYTPRTSPKLPRPTITGAAMRAAIADVCPDTEPDLIEAIVLWLDAQETQERSLRAEERKRADVARARRRWIREQGWLDTASGPA